MGYSGALFKCAELKAKTVLERRYYNSKITETAVEVVFLIKAKFSSFLLTTCNAEWFVFKTSVVLKFRYLGSRGNLEA